MLRASGNRLHEQAYKAIVFQPPLEEEPSEAAPSE
jgi:hypothetical protein